MKRDRYIVRSETTWTVGLVSRDGTETVIEVAASEEAARAVAARLDLQVERLLQADQGLPRNWREK